jgi:hypothetical protein
MTLLLVALVVLLVLALAAGTLWLRARGRKPPRAAEYVESETYRW